MQNLEPYLTQWLQIKRDIRELKVQEENLRNFFNNYMDAQFVEEIITPSYQLRRKVQSRECVKKGSVPAHIWDAYKQIVEYEALYLKPR